MPIFPLRREDILMFQFYSLGKKAYLFFLYQKTKLKLLNLSEVKLPKTILNSIFG